VKRYKLTKVQSTKYQNHIQIFDTKTEQIILYVDIFDFINNSIYKEYPNYVYLESNKILKNLRMVKEI